MKTSTILLIIMGWSLVVQCTAAYYPDAMLPTKTGFIPTFNRSVDGERNIGQWYDWKINNVSGLADVEYHYIVYDAYFRNSYEYFSVNFGQWVMQDPDPGKKFLFVWVCGYSEGTTWYGWGQDRFMLWLNNDSITPEPVSLIDVDKFYRGGSLSDQTPPRTIRFMENHTSYQDFTYSSDPYAWNDGLELTRMEPGKSNAWNGYLIYQVPENIQMENLRIAGWFGYYGTPWWNLVPKPYEQVSIEYQAIGDQDTIVHQINNRIRLRVNESIRERV